MFVFVFKFGERSGVHKKMRDQSTLKLKNTIILYSPEVRQLLNVNSVEGQGKGLGSKGREVSDRLPLPLVSTATLPAPERKR